MTAPRDRRLLTVAIGGSALRASGGAAGPDDWFATLAAALPPLADLLARGFRLVVTHGGRPPADAAALDVGLAAGQGALGYAIQQVLGNLCRTRKLDVPVAAVVTRVVVEADDPAFRRPATPVGPFFTTAQARVLVRKRGWTLIQATREGFRRVVPSPRPVRVVEAELLRRLCQGGAVGIACGGGGIPVVETPTGYRGVEALVEPDLAGEALATGVGADRLVILTGMERVVVNLGTPQELGVERLTPGEARALLAAGEFPATSMGPKIEAGLRFVESGGRETIITCLAQVGAALDGDAGTHLVP